MSDESEPKSTEQLEDEDLDAVAGGTRIVPRRDSMKAPRKPHGKADEKGIVWVEMEEI